MHSAVPFGPTGEIVYNRTYSRTKEDGSKETWPETVRRVALGNLALVHTNDGARWPAEAVEEYKRLVYYMDNFALLPAGRHLWSTGVEGRQYLFNCHVAGWGEKLSEHFEFSFLRLMEGGGVGANYSMKHIARFGAPRRKIDLRITCGESHADIDELRPHLSEKSLFYYGGYVEDSREGWARSLSNLIDSFYDGLEGSYEGFGTDYYTIPDDYPLQFDVSEVRPSGSELKTFGGTASGPAPFAAMMRSVAEILNKAHDAGTLTPMDVMEIDHAIAECVVSGGNRRSARMSIVKWDDPYIMEFLACKKDTGKHWTTNISVEIDDEFLKQLPLGYFRGGPCARGVHAAVVKGMLENGEPGYWNSSLSSKGETGEVIATNPCGEISLEPWENCNLGHVNMDYFHDKPWEDLVEAHRLMTRFLMRATYGDVNDSRQEKLLARNRRIGVGHLGVQGYWAKRGVRYSGIPGGAAAIELQRLYKEVRQEARSYAFKLRIPEPVKVTSVAPTGSVAKLPGVSEGIHPIYARHFERRIRFSKRDPAQFQTVMDAMAEGFTVEDDVYDQSGMTAVVVYPTQDILISQVMALGHDDSVVESADELSITDMLNVQRTYQKYWADNGISYTVNIPEGRYTVPELAEILAYFLPELKGTTIMVDSTRPQAPYTRITQAEFEKAVAARIEDGTSEECSRGMCPTK